MRNPPMVELWMISHRWILFLDREKLQFRWDILISKEKKKLFFIEWNKTERGKEK